MGKMKAIYQDELEAEYTRGAKDAYYGRQRTPIRSDIHKLEAYYEGYSEAPYGFKDFGADEGD